MNKRIKIVAATAADKTIASAEWYTYSGPKRAFDNHHKEYNIDIAKGDKFGILKSGAKFVLLHEDDPSIKFKISEEEIASLKAKAKPFSGKIKGVTVSAPSAAPVKPESVVEVKTTRFIKTTPVIPKEGDTILVDLDGKEETAVVVGVVPKRGYKDFDVVPKTGKYAKTKIRVGIPQILKIIKEGKPPKTVKQSKTASFVPQAGDLILVDLDGKEETAVVVGEVSKGFEVIPETGQYANVKIRVSVDQILKIVKKKPAPPSISKDEENYIKMSDITGVGYIIEVKQKKYVIVDNTEDSLKKFSPKQLLMPLDPSNSTAALKVESMDKLKPHLKERMPYKLFLGHQKAYDKRKKAIEENRAKASKLDDLNIRSGDTVLYNFPKGQESITVVAVYPTDNLIEAKIRGKVKKLSADGLVSVVKRGSGVTNITM